MKSDKRLAFFYAALALFLLAIAAGGALARLGTGYSLERFREEQAARQVRQRPAAALFSPFAAPDADTSPSLGAPPVRRPDSNP